MAWACLSLLVDGLYWASSLHISTSRCILQPILSRRTPGHFLAGLDHLDSRSNRCFASAHYQYFPIALSIDQHELLSTNQNGQHEPEISQSSIYPHGELDDDGWNSGSYRSIQRCKLSRSA